MTGNHHGCTTLSLEEQAALIVLLGEVLGAEIVDARLQAVKESVFHGVLLLSLSLGIWVTGCYAIIGNASFPLEAMWQVIMVNFKILFLIEKTYNHLPHCPKPCDLCKRRSIELGDEPIADEHRGFLAAVLGALADYLGKSL